MLRSTSSVLRTTCTYRFMGCPVAIPFTTWRVVRQVPSRLDFRPSVIAHWKQGIRMLVCPPCRVFLTQAVAVSLQIQQYRSACPGAFDLASCLQVPDRAGALRAVIPAAN